MAGCTSHKAIDSVYWPTLLGTQGFRLAQLSDNWKDIVAELTRKDLRSEKYSNTNLSLLMDSGQDGLVLWFGSFIGTLSGKPELTWMIKSVSKLSVGSDQPWHPSVAE